MIRVLIVDDHAVVRAGLARLLDTDDDIQVVATAADGAQAVVLVREYRPDVVLMDLSMPVLDGASATAAIRAASPEVRVVVFTSFSDRERILNALDAGAVGYLLKDADPRELLAGIRAAASGDSPLHPKAATAVLGARARDRHRDHDRDRRTPKLSTREREVLQLVAKGLTNQRIAARLGISEKTVKTHLTSVFREIGVAQRTEAALWANANLD